MEIRMMFWTIAGLCFVGVLIIVGMTLGGSLMKLQTCGAEDTYTASAPDSVAEDVFNKFFKDGTPCGEIDGKTAYCRAADVQSPGVRGVYRERDACVDIQKHLCCRKCYEALGTNEGGAECGYQEDSSGQKHYYMCIPDIKGSNGESMNPDVCTNPEAHRCCRDLELNT